MMCVALFGHKAIAQNQSKWVEGYIVTKQKDTVRGQYEAKAEKNRGVYLNFRTNSKAAPTEYRASQLLAYGIDGVINEVIYESIRLKNKQRSQYGLDAVFAKKLVGGALNLYYFHYDPSLPPSYYIEMQDSAKNDTTYFIDFKGVKVISEFSNQKVAIDLAVMDFYGLLEHCYFNPYTELLPYEPESFMRLAINYNECQAEQTYKFKKPGYKFTLVTTFQPSFTSNFDQTGFQFDIPRPFLERDRDYTASGTYEVGAAIEIKRDLNENVNIFRLGVRIGSTNIASNTRGQIEGQLQSLLINPGFRRETRGEKWRFYGAAAFQFGFIINNGPRFTFTEPDEEPVDFNFTESRFLTGYEAEIGFRRIYNEKSSGIIGLRISSLRRSLPQGAAHTQIIFGPVFGYAFAL